MITEQSNSLKETNFVIVDTGCANLSSVKFAVERLGYQIKVTDDIEQIKAADKVIFPGVGSAKHAMKNIVDKGLVTTLQQLTQPVLGFCLGMQLMTESSTEGTQPSTEGNQSSTKGKDASEQSVPCLNLIPTKVAPLQSKGNRLPHMGWNTLTLVGDHPIFKGISSGDYVYFVHSFAAPVSEYTIASCAYGSKFSAAIAKDNFIGCQFHPERSAAVGSTIINNFLALSPQELVS